MVEMKISCDISISEHLLVYLNSKIHHSVKLKSRVAPEQFHLVLASLCAFKPSSSSAPTLLVNELVFFYST